VSEAGGFSFLAVGYLSADALRDQLRDLRARTARPFGVNLFVPGRPAVDEAASAALSNDYGRKPSATASSPARVDSTTTAGRT
jgi:NAD(P)H-dependent flavin oxidoreductase YrpB (nitropropane dioxygenase family)